MSFPSSLPFTREREFPQFAKLAQEIQDLIWDHAAVAGPRVQHLQLGRTEVVRAMSREQLVTYLGQYLYTPEEHQDIRRPLLARDPLMQTCRASRERAIRAATFVISDPFVDVRWLSKGTDCPAGLRELFRGVRSVAVSGRLYHHHIPVLDTLGDPELFPRLTEVYRLRGSLGFEAGGVARTDIAVRFPARDLPGRALRALVALRQCLARGDGLIMQKARGEMRLLTERGVRILVSRGPWSAGEAAKMLEGGDPDEAAVVPAVPATRAERWQPRRAMLLRDRFGRARYALSPNIQDCVLASPTSLVAASDRFHDIDRYWYWTRARGYVEAAMEPLEPIVGRILDRIAAALERMEPRLERQLSLYLLPVLVAIWIFWGVWCLYAMWAQGVTPQTVQRFVVRRAISNFGVVGTIVSGFV
ncbi:hypothetical protein F4778DRAFT_296664 [Xylariomycetidae sp. FL2044]|nr:hypothetical protein F4778DRAFT_296664 [Xylariomycetidae sp. FL2044]